MGSEAAADATATNRRPLISAGTLLGIGLAYCARTLLPEWGLDGGSAFFLPNVVCSSGDSSPSLQTARTGE